METVEYIKKYNKKNYPAEYRIWKNMRARCKAPCLSHLNYQKKNIKVCKRWDSFKNFMLDMGERPKGYSIDRIDNNGDYESNNCRWADNNTQAKNRGNFNINIEYKGKIQCLKDWSKELNINYRTLYCRMFRIGMSFEEAINYVDKRDALIFWQGSYYNKQQLCEMYNIPIQVFYDRKSRGWNIEKILTQPIRKSPTK